MTFIDNNNMHHVDIHHIDWDKIKTIIEDLVPFMNDIIDVNKYPIPEIEKATKKSRKIGIGIMGFADLLVKLNIPYTSNDALKYAEMIMIKPSIINYVAAAAAAFGLGRRGAGAVLPRRTITPVGHLAIAASVCGEGWYLA